MANRFTTPLAGYIYGLALGCWIMLSSVLLLPLPVQGQAEPLADCNTNQLLLVVSALNLEPRDAALVNHLAQQGFLIDTKTGKAVTAGDANGKALVLVSESVTSAEVGSKFRDVAVPVLTWEGWIFDNMRMTGTEANQHYGELLPETQIRIIDTSHPLAAGLTGDVLMLNSTSTTEDRKFHWGSPGKAATIVAVSRKNNNYAHIFAYEKGAAMVGLNAPARRVGFPNGSGHRFTPEGWQLFDAAVAWAKSCSSDPVPTPTFISTTPPTTPAATPPAATVTAPAPTATPPAPATPAPTATTRPGTTPTRTPTPTALPTGSPAQLRVIKTDFLYTDSDQNELVSAGDTMLYTIKINNLGGRPAYQIRLVDPPDPNSTLLIGTATTDGGAVVKGNGEGDAHIVVEVPELAGGGRVLISFQVQVNGQNSLATLQNQAITTFVEQIPEPRSQTTVVSDDPDTPTSPDTTVTVLNAPLAQLKNKLFLPILGR